VSYVYRSAFGEYEIPADVQARSFRLERRFGRTGYLDEWCRWQWQKSFDQ